ncbi:partner of Y14 and mago [Zonotrichia leucophrys gambelii]|uniref:partner of Y14 and mago n=1 Tax=Zonotrichia leucophrys gambelii TaxID=257770 RepID=UPI00313FE21F
MATPYVTDETGRYIPSTQRPDGTWRKQRRVKEGYVPQRGPVYENKYVKFFRSKPELPPGLNPEAAAPSPPGRGTPGRPDGGGCDPSPTLSKSARRNLKRKEKRKQQQEKDRENHGDGLSQELEKINLGGGGGGDSGGSSGTPSGSAPVPSPGSAPVPSPGSAPGSSERGRRMKSLRKKLRQVQELQQRLEQGALPEPSREQLDKLARRRALEEELRALELDSE